MVEIRSDADVGRDSVFSSSRFHVNLPHKTVTYLISEISVSVNISIFYQSEPLPDASILDGNVVTVSVRSQAYFVRRAWQILDF